MADAQPVTLGTIAALAGVSRMTVSLALRPHTRISQPVREKIQALARQVGYRPDPTVARFMSYLRTAKPHCPRSVIGFLHCMRERAPWKHDQRFSKFYTSATQRCETLGYKLDEFWVNEPGMSPRRLERILNSRGIEGVLLTPLLQGGSYAALSFAQLAVVAIGYSVLKPQVNRVSANHFHATSLALENVEARGYRNPGLYIRKYVDETYGHQIAAAFRYHEYRFARSSKSWPSLIAGDMDKNEFLQWVDAKKPDVVLGPSLAQLEWLKEAGYRVPEDIGYVNLSRLEEDAGCAGIILNYEGVATAAVDLLVTHINHGQKGIPKVPFSLQIEGEWMSGRTIKKSRICSSVLNNKQFPARRETGNYCSRPGKFSLT